MSIPWAETEVPYITTAQMVEVDRAMIEDFGIDLVRMMENAGRCLADLARLRFLDGDPRGRRVAVLAGTGGNGGGAMVAARRLHGYGADVAVWATKRALTTVPAEQAAILQQIGIELEFDEKPQGDFDLAIDGVIGYSLRGDPRGTAADLIEWANDVRAPVLALDAPSGLDVGSGVRYSPSVTATATMTLALPKAGLMNEPGVGELYLADISVPRELYTEPPLNINVAPIFARSDIVRLN